MSECFRKLGLSPSATQLEIKQAWRKLCMTHHPDRGGSDKDFQELHAAYNEANTLVETGLNKQTCGICEGRGWLVVQRGVSSVKVKCLCRIIVRGKP